MELPDILASSFTKNKNEAVWQKIDACPLTHACLNSENVRKKFIVLDNGVINLTTEPVSAYLMDLKEYTKICYDYLLVCGFNWYQIRNTAPKFCAVTTDMTAPMSRERQDNIENLKGSDNLFHAAGGQHINRNEYFIANESKKKRKGNRHSHQGKGKAAVDRSTKEDLFQPQMGQFI